MSSQTTDIFVSFRFAEALAEANMLKEELESDGITVFVAAVKNYLALLTSYTFICYLYICHGCMAWLYS
jgi:hypothetical protein